METSRVDESVILARFVHKRSVGQADEASKWSSQWDMDVPNFTVLCPAGVAEMKVEMKVAQK